MDNSLDLLLSWQDGFNDLSFSAGRLSSDDVPGSPVLGADVSDRVFLDNRLVVNDCMVFFPENFT